MVINSVQHVPYAELSAQCGCSIGNDAINEEGPVRLSAVEQGLAKNFQAYQPRRPATEANDSLLPPWASWRSKRGGSCIHEGRGQEDRALARYPHALKPGSLADFCGQLYRASHVPSKHAQPVALDSVSDLHVKSSVRSRVRCFGTPFCRVHHCHGRAPFRFRRGQSGRAWRAGPSAALPCSHGCRRTP